MTKRPRKSLQKVKVKKSMKPRGFLELLGELNTTGDRAASVLMSSDWRKERTEEEIMGVPHPRMQG